VDSRPIGKTVVSTLLFLVATILAPTAWAQTSSPAPVPLEAPGKPVDWLFLFKMNAAIFPSDPNAERSCAFGGTPQPYPAFSQDYAFADGAQPALQQGTGLIGTGDDPLGATFAELYGGTYHYVVWNDQFYQHPGIAGCSDSCSSPWGHSKGLLAWNDAGEGLVLQVTTPSWPAAASSAHPRDVDGNTLGCVEDNNVKVSQHFFVLRLSEPDVEHVLDALANASVVTDPANPELVATGGPAAIQQKVALLGRKSSSTAVLKFKLSSGVTLIAKPSALAVPPWQLVSAELGGIDLRAATWWTSPAIPSTTATTPISCWAPGLIKPGAVQIATSGTWATRVIGLKGGPMPDANHAKIGVSTSGTVPLTIFGDMNQQGTLSGKCSSSQNGRGGLFFVLEDAALHDSVSALIAGGSAPFTLAAKAPKARRVAKPKVHRARKHVVTP
jgi:hypothetical protein